MSSVEERIITAVVDVLKNAGIEGLKRIHYGFPTRVVDQPFAWVELSPTVETRFEQVTANRTLDMYRIDVGVFVRDVDGERAEKTAGRLAEAVRQALMNDPTFGGVVSDSRVERMTAEPGRQGNQAVAVRRLVLTCFVYGGVA